MNFNLNPMDFMNDAQKKELSDIIFNKLKEGVEQIKFSSTTKIDLAKLIKEDLETYAEGDGLIQYDDIGDLSKAIVSNLVGSMKKSVESK